MYHSVSDKIFSFSLVSLSDPKVMVTVMKEVSTVMKEVSVQLISHYKSSAGTVHVCVTKLN